MTRRLLSLGLLALLGCGTDGSDTDSGTTPTATEPGPGAFVTDYAASAEFFTQMAGPALGGSPHGTVQIWYSTNIQGVVEAGSSFTAPVGTVAIKPFEAADGSTGTAVMVKEDAGFDAANGDWSYEMRGPDDSVMDSGAIEMCISCHSAASSTDYLAGTGLK